LARSGPAANCERGFGAIGVFIIAEPLYPVRATAGGIFLARLAANRRF
jgi:hypothetical protein